MDFDGDGDLDLPMLSLQGVRLMENTLGRDGRHFARFRLKATKTQHHALGAEVIVTADGVTQRDYVKLNAGFQTQVPLELHFGLGAAASGELETVEVRWPSGAVERHEGLPIDRKIELEEGKPPQVAALRRWPEASRPVSAGTHDLQARAKSLDGAEVPVAAVDGRPTVVNFWAPWCAPCKEELPELRAVAKRYGDAVRFVGVSVETEDTASVTAAIAEHRLKYEQRYATPEVLQSFFGGDGRAPLPSTFVFDGHGRLRRAVHRKITRADLEGLIESFDKDPALHKYLLPMAEAALQRRDVDEALALLERAYEGAPDNPMVLAQLGTVLSIQGAGPRSIRLLEQATGKDPGFAYAWYRLGHSYKQAKRLDDALAAFERALALRPKEPSYLMGVGAMKSQRGDNAAAAKLFEALVADRPHDVEGWMNLAKTRMLLRDRDGAITALERVVKLAPRHGEAQKLLRLARQPL